MNQKPHGEAASPPLRAYLGLAAVAGPVAGDPAIVRLCRSGIAERSAPVRVCASPPAAGLDQADALEFRAPSGWGALARGVAQAEIDRVHAELEAASSSTTVSTANAAFGRPPGRDTPKPSGRLTQHVVKPSMRNALTRS